MLDNYFIKHNSDTLFSLSPSDDFVFYAQAGNGGVLLHAHGELCELKANVIEMVYNVKSNTLAVYLSYNQRVVDGLLRVHTFLGWYACEDIFVNLDGTYKMTFLSSYIPEMPSKLPKLGGDKNDKAL